MAIKFNEQYPARSNPPSSEYPSGSYRNRSTPDAHDGTYLDEVWANDKYGFLVKLLKEAGIEPNGEIDNAVNSQYYDALMVLIGARFLQSVAGDATDKGVSQLAIKNALALKSDTNKTLLIADLVGALGDSTVTTITQKEITKQFNDVNTKITNLTSEVSAVSSQNLVKTDIYSTVFVKTAADKIAIKAGTKVFVNGQWVLFNTQTPVTTSANMITGVDYIVAVKTNGTVRAIADPFNAPATVGADELIIGGFHYSLVPKNATVESGAFATTNVSFGMIWTQADVDKIRGVNEFSFWDLRFRAKGVVNIPGHARNGQLSNHGMVFDPSTNIYVGIYFLNSNTDVNGLSRAGTDIASGTVKPTIPKSYGGDGTLKYANMDWWTTKEMVSSQGARLMFDFEFNSRAWGVTENKPIGGGSVTYPKTERLDGQTSRIGCEQATGVQWYWGVGGSTNPPLFGGSRVNTASVVSSRRVDWDSSPGYSVWYSGGVAVRDLLVL